MGTYSSSSVALVLSTGLRLGLGLSDRTAAPVTSWVGVHVGGGTPTISDWL